MIVEYTNDSFRLYIRLKQSETDFAIDINGVTILVIPLDFAQELAKLQYNTLRRMLYYLIEKCDFIKWESCSLETTLHQLSANVITKCLKVAFTTYID